MMVTNNFPEKSKSVFHMFLEAFHRFPDHTCIITEEHEYTYKQVYDHARHIASILAMKGARKGDYIGVYQDKSEHLIFSILAIMMIGGVYVPISKTNPDQRVRYILQDAEIRYLLTDTDIAERINLNSFIQIILKDASHSVSTDKGYGSCPAEETECSSEASRFGDDEGVIADGLFPDYHADDIAYLIYTSGSSGAPKGVLITQAGFYNRMKWQKNYFKMDDKQKVLFKAPLGFDISLWEIFLPLISGSTLVVAKESAYKSISKITSMILQYGITIVQFVPSLLELFLERVESIKNTHDFKLRKVVSSGEALSIAHIKRFLKLFSTCSLYNFYGPTETSICITAKEYHANTPVDYVSIGSPIDNVNIYLLDENMDIIRSDNTEGEIYVSGVCVGKGYLNDSEKTEAAFLKNNLDEWPVIYKTGDKAKYMNNELVYLGRTDQCIKINGNRVELDEIKYHMNQLPFIKSSAVTVFEKEQKTKTIAAFYIAEGDVVDARNAITEHLKKNLPDYMIPSVIKSVQKIPLTDNGKVDFRALLKELEIA